jgi:uncharacterized protein (TIGR03437 family)
MLKRTHFSLTLASWILMVGVVPCRAEAPTKQSLRQAWRASMSRKPLPKRGCFNAEYPGTEWVRVPCVDAPLRDQSGTEPRPHATVGNGNDFAAQSSSSHISEAIGSFPGVFGVTSEIDSEISTIYGPNTPNAFSLQLNSNLFPVPSLCQGCRGFEQFVFLNYPGGGVSGIFIEYWVLSTTFPADPCPTGFAYSSQAQGCFLNTPMAPFNTTIQDLGNLTLLAEAGAQGMDAVSLYTEPGGGPGAQIIASAQESVLGLTGNWNAAEFNVFGYLAYTQANFNQRATIVVQLSINDGTTNAPTCIQTGFTAEENSLTLMPDSNVSPVPTCLPFYGENAGGSPLPSIEFLESNYGPEGMLVTALPPSSVTPTSAVLNGEINPIGTEGLAWIEYSTQNLPSCNSPQLNAQLDEPPPTPPVNAGSGEDYVQFSAPIVGLSPGTTYYFWACALGALYQANSNVESFVTPALTPPLPAVSPGGVIMASAFGAFAEAAPGGWIEIYGTNLAAGVQSWTSADFNGINAPTALGNTYVTIGGQQAFVDYVSPGQVNVLIPSNVPTGQPQLTVTTPAGSSAAYSLSINTVEPGLLAPTNFNVGGAQYVVAQFADGTYALPTGALNGVPSRPAVAGDVLVIYGVGFGPVTPDIPAGQLVGEANALASDFSIFIGGLQCQVRYDGLAPDFTGLYQFDIVVPSGIPSGAALLTFTVDGANGTQTFYVPIGS